MRELLLGARRTTRANDDDPVHTPSRDPSREAGKLVSDDLLDRPQLWSKIAGPGKVRRDDIDSEAMSPANALRYAEWISERHVARRAELGGAEIDDAGALTSAFGFIDESRGGRPLPADLAAGLSAELGVDLGAVRVHTDERAAAAAAALRARAFTIGTDIYFAANAFDPTSDDGVSLIAHEVTHVAQNLRGTAPATGRRVSRPEDAHERQADELAARFRARRAGDPAELVNHVRRTGTRTTLPFLRELEDHFGVPLDFVETYTGEAAQLACQLMSASAFAIRNVVALADQTPQRDKLMHELTHIMQMGRTRAPERFTTGSVTIGVRGSEVEQEAARAPSQPVVSASPDTVHRAGPGSSGTSSTPGSGEPVDLKKAIASFKAKPAAALTEVSTADAERVKCHYGVAAVGYLTQRLYTTSKPFNGEKFAAALKAEMPSIQAADLQKAWALNDTTAKLAKIKGTDDTLYIVYSDSEAVLEVDDLSATKAWLKYKTAVDTLKGKGLAEFSWPVEGPQTGKWKSFDAAYTDNEEKKYREPMRDAIAKMPRYSADVGHWDNFYTEVVRGKLFPYPLNRITGDIFGKIVATSAAAADDKKFTDPEAGDPIFDAKKYGLDGKDKEAHGDGVAFDGGKRAIIFECKAQQKGPDGRAKLQARNYKKIITQHGEGFGYKYKGEEVERNEFTHVIYAIADESPDKKLAQKWYQALFVDTDDGGPIFTLEQASIVPSWDGAPEFTFGFNPQFTVQLGAKNDPATHFSLKKPPIAHPGIEFNTIDVTVDPTKTKVVSGSVNFDFKAGDIEKKNVVKTFAPAPEGKLMATADGKLKGLQSALDKLLGPVHVDAAIVSDGIEATLDIQGGAAKSIAGFTVDAVKLKAKYTTANTLDVAGTVGFKHKSGKIAGNVTIGWRDGWSFSGDLEVKDGMIPGVSAFSCSVEYADGKAVIGVDRIAIEKKFKAITLTGTGRRLQYDTKAGAFSGDVSVSADLGMFGRASADATIADNELKKCTLSYDSPELTYPPKSSKPAFKGTIGGSVTYDAGKFSGAIRGTAHLNVPALQKIAGDGGLGLQLDGHINPDGSYGGSIRTLSPLKFGKHFEVPSLDCTINDDGSVTGDFSIKIKGIKHLETAEIGCRIDKDGFRVVKADVHASIGTPADKLWGTIDVGYDEAAGLKITGTLNVKIKEGMVATGTLTYNTQTNAIDVALTVDEITLFDFTKTQNLFKFSKQIPLVSFYQIIGIYLDLGLDLDFDFSMKLGLKPTISLDNLSLETWHYDKISAEIQLLGQLRAALTATPKVGLGLFAISPELLRGGGGLKIPITGEALLNPTGTLKVGYKPDGGVEGDAQIGMQLTFGIRGAVKPYAEAAVLDGAWNPSWTGDSLADFEILPPKELFNFTLDLAGDMKPKQPQIPTSPQPPSATKGKQLPQEAPKTSQVGDNGPGKDATPPSTAPAGGGAADDSMFKMSSLTGALKGLPGYQMISGFMEKAAKVWDQIKGFFGRVMKAFKSFFSGIANAIEEVINGFAKDGLGYLPKLIQKIVGPQVWDIIEPIINAAAHSGEEILQLFESDPPHSPQEFFMWGLKLMRKAFGIAFDSLPALVSALQTMLSRLGGLAAKIVTHMVQEGMIGVKRHKHSFFGMGGYTAADEFKINLLGVSIHVKDELTWMPDPSDLASLPATGLWDAFERMGVPHNGDPMRDRWVG